MILNGQMNLAYTKYLPPRPKFWSASLCGQKSEISEMHRMASDWPWTLNFQNYHAYTKYFPLRPKFWCILLYDQPFSRYGTFYNSPLATVLNGKIRRKIAKNPNFQISQLF